MAEKKEVEIPTVNIAKKDVPINKPLDEITLEEAKRRDRSSAGGHMEVKERVKSVPARDYTTTPSPPPDFGIADAEEPTTVTIHFNRFAQVNNVTFSGQGAILSTAGRVRSFASRIIQEGAIERQRLKNARIIASVKAKAGASTGKGKK